MATNSNFPLITCLLKLCKATCCATHCGSSDTSASASQNWSTKVYANKPTTILALKEDIWRRISKIPSRLCQIVIEISSKERKFPSKAEEDIYLMRCSTHNSRMSTLWLNKIFGISLKTVFYLKLKFSALIGTPYIIVLIYYLSCPCKHSTCSKKIIVSTLVKQYSPGLAFIRTDVSGYCWNLIFGHFLRSE